MEKDSPWPQNQRKESKMNSVERIQELKKSLQEQNDLSETLSSSCNLQEEDNEEDNEDFEGNLPGNLVVEDGVNNEDLTENEGNLVVEDGVNNEDLTENEGNLVVEDGVNNEDLTENEEFGSLELSQKLKDDLAVLMTQQDWQKICNQHLPGEEERVKCDNQNVYDQAYAVVCLLMERGIVSTWSDMELVLDSFNKAIPRKFKEKYKRSALAPGYTFDKDESDSLGNDDYIFLCEKIGHRWKRFARQVNIKENTIVNSANQSHSDSDRCYKIFRELEARDGSVKQNLIIMALQDLEYDTILSKFKSRKHVSN